MAETMKNNQDDFETWVVFACQAKRPNYIEEMEEAEQSKVIGLNVRLNANDKPIESEKGGATIHRMGEAQKHRNELREFLFEVQAIEGGRK